MSLRDELRKELELKNKVLSELDRYGKEIFEVEDSMKELEELKSKVLTLQTTVKSSLEGLEKKLSTETFEELFGSKKVRTSKKTEDCSKESINFQTVERFLKGEGLSKIASDVYKDKTDKDGNNRVDEGKANFDTVYLTGRHIEDFFRKCPKYGKISKGMSKKANKIYPPVIELSEVGKELFGE